MIEEYSFGSMKIDGQTYENDLKIFPDGIRPDWWREEGHTWQSEDIKDVLNYDPELVIIGQGHSSRMKLSKEVIRVLEDEGIEFIALNTQKAVEEFNNASGRVVGLFHLTC